jgi:hypothetical protein
MGWMRMADEKGRFLTSRANLCWVTFALLIYAVHLILEHRFPQLNPPATPDKPEWIRMALCGEFLADIVVFGAVVTAIRNRIPALKNPGYRDDGTLTIATSQMSRARAVRWGEIGIIVAEFAVYLALWALVYGII